MNGTDIWILDISYWYFEKTAKVQKESQNLQGSRHEGFDQVNSSMFIIKIFTVRKEAAKTKSFHHSKYCHVITFKAVRAEYPTMHEFSLTCADDE